MKRDIRNLPLQVGCRSSRRARSPGCLTLHSARCTAVPRPRRRVRVYTCTQRRALGAVTCTYYIYTWWRTTRFVTARCCRHCRSARAPSPSPSVSRLFFYSEQPRRPKPLVLLSPYRGDLSAYSFSLSLCICTPSRVFSPVVVCNCNSI